MGACVSKNKKEKKGCVLQATNLKETPEKLVYKNDKLPESQDELMTKCEFSEKDKIDSKDKDELLRENDKLLIKYEEQNELQIKYELLEKEKNDWKAKAGMFELECALLKVELLTKKNDALNAEIDKMKENSELKDENSRYTESETINREDNNGFKKDRPISKKKIKGSVQKDNCIRRASGNVGCISSSLQPPNEYTANNNNDDSSNDNLRMPTMSNSPSSRPTSFFDEIKAFIFDPTDGSSSGNERESSYQNFSGNEACITEDDYRLYDDIRNSI